MQIAKVYVNDLEARTIYGKKITKGLRGGRVSLEYAGGIWEGLTKNVAFTNGLETVGILNAGLEVEIPPEVTETAGVEIRVGVCGVDGTGVVIPTVWASLGEVLEAAPSDFKEADKELTPSVTEQLLSLIGPMDELGTEAKDSLVAAINEVIKLAGGDIDPEAIAEALAEYLAANPIQETDPTVPAWAKQPEKPSYTAAEVGAQIADCVVTFSEVNGEWTADKTFEEVREAFEAGANVYGRSGDFLYDLYSLGGGEGFGFVDRQRSDSSYRMFWLWEGDSVTEQDGSMNVASLMFTGAVVKNYDGTQSVTVDIPTVPTKVSAFQNDKGYQTASEVNALINAALAAIPNAAEVAY